MLVTLSIVTPQIFPDNVNGYRSDRRKNAEDNTNALYGTEFCFGAMTIASQDKGIVCSIAIGPIRWRLRPTVKQACFKNKRLSPVR